MGVKIIGRKAVEKLFLQPQAMYYLPKGKRYLYNRDIWWHQLNQITYINVINNRTNKTEVKIKKY